MATYSKSSCVFENKYIILYDSETQSKKFKINTIDNTIDSFLDIEEPSLIITKQCSKYHFFYNGIATFSKNKVENIILDKYHFIRIHEKAHFTINENFINSTTVIKMTTPDYKTKEMILPLINFYSLSKKKMDLKLKNIQLLS